MLSKLDFQTLLLDCSVHWPIVSLTASYSINQSSVSQSGGLNYEHNWMLPVDLVTRVLNERRAHISESYACEGIQWAFKSLPDSRRGAWGRCAVLCCGNCQQIRVQIFSMLVKSSEFVQCPWHKMPNEVEAKNFTQCELWPTSPPPTQKWLWMMENGRISQQINKQTNNAKRNETKRTATKYK